ncbi:RsiV family protein [Halobacillus sp. MO56]
MKIKNIYSVLAFMLLFVGFTASVQAEEGLIYEMKNVDEVENRWEIHFQYAEFTGLEDKAFQQKLNKMIEEKVARYIQTVKEQADDNKGMPIRLYGETKVLVDNNFYSVLMTSSLSRGNTFSGDVESFNFYNQKDTQLATLMDIMDLDKIDAEVKKQISSKPDVYFVEEFKHVRPDTAFYLQGEELVLIFNKYEIAPGVYGTSEIKIPINHRY